ncbi:gpW family head-tail joining protein [Reyranella sp.]|uniref:gpW family head-tail joining protein n=1 Tax=Reyranella sp. TaxID=1929291 RepID=UPI003C7C162C
MATTQQLTTWMAEAEQARHELIVGNRPVSVSTGSGKSVTYTATDLGKLDAYIASLRKQLGQPTGVGLPFVPTF